MPLYNGMEDGGICYYDAIICHYSQELMAHKNLCSYDMPLSFDTDKILNRFILF
jgi:hypothetical protein